jgi:acetyltransferase-like isoleucine patch superfamily enzyme
VRRPSLTAAHRDRLRSVGVPENLLADLELHEAGDQLPEWFTERGNAVYLAGGLAISPWLAARLVMYPFSDGLIVLGSRLDTLSLLLSGTGATVFVGAQCELTAGEIFCGAGSSVVLHGQVVATGEAVLDARNGGSIVAEQDQLWAARVYIATDDMHGLEDLATGVRLNAFGGRIRLGRHVWLGREAIVTGHVEIGDCVVVGLRSLVRGQTVPAHVAVAGTPARVIREAITWRADDVASPVS